MKELVKLNTIIFVLILGGCAAASASAQTAKPVVLAKKGDVISGSLPGAANYFVREVALSETDKAKIKAQGNFSPQVSKLDFYYGEKSGGELVGTVVFNRMETSHGMVEVGVAFTPAGAVSNVVVTKATAETEPWIKSAEKAGVMKHLVGMSSASMTDPIKNLSSEEIGAMPYLMAQVIAAAVTQSVVYYDLLFRPQLP